MVKLNEALKCMTTAKNVMGHGEAGWWKQQFDNADVDRNGTLSFDEFKEYVSSFPYPFSSLLKFGGV